MSATYVQTGDTIDYTPAADVSAGDVVVQGTLVGVALRNIAANTLGALAVRGVFDFDKEEVAISAGEDVYYDTDSGLAFTSAVGTYLGKCVQDAAADDGTVRVLLVQQEAAVSGTATGTGTGVA